MATAPSAYHVPLPTQPCCAMSCPPPVNTHHLENSSHGLCQKGFSSIPSIHTFIYPYTMQACRDSLTDLSVDIHGHKARATIPIKPHAPYQKIPCRGGGRGGVIGGHSFRKTLPSTHTNKYPMGLLALLVEEPQRGDESQKGTINSQAFIPVEQ